MIRLGFEQDEELLFSILRSFVLLFTHQMISLCILYYCFPTVRPMLIFLSCTSQSSERNFVFGEDNPEQVAENEYIESTGEWTIGDVEDCPEGTTEPSWWNASSLLWGDERTDQTGQPAGCVAVYPVGSELLVAATTKEYNVRWGYLYDEQKHDVLVDPASVRLRIEDLDGDGELDAEHGSFISYT